MKLLGFIMMAPAIVFAATVLETFDAPDTGITGLAYGGGSLWAVDGTTQNVYEINPDNGAVLSSFYVTDQTSSYNPVPGGLAYGNGLVYLAMYSGSTYGKIYKYNPAGAYQGNFDAYC